MSYSSVDKQTRRRLLLCFILALGLHIVIALCITALMPQKPTLGAADNVVHIKMVASASSPASAGERAEQLLEEKAQDVVQRNRLPSVAAPVALAEQRQPSADDGALRSSRIDQQRDEPIEAGPTKADDVEDDGQSGGPVSEVADAATAVLAADKASWHQRVRLYLESQKRFPRRALVRQQEGVVTIQIVVDRQGNVIRRTLVKSSGHDVLDRAAVDLFAIASPLPAPPAELPSSALLMDIPIEYTLR
jgi:protein TonB|tara:strand:- start:208734 stop:209477 length:744 start_codon:yes stop_codon:yes gene_type:complete